MNLTMRVSLRNLTRQKRRSILLGLGIGFGVMFLVVAHSFSNGISDLILNRFLVNVFSHITVHVTEKGQKTMSIIRDKDEIIDIITSNINNIKHIREEVGTLVRAIGNGGSDYIVIAGMAREDEYLFDSLLTIIEGDLNDFRNESIENPLILFSEKAKELNVKPGDKVKIRLTTIYGQIQSEILTLVAIVKSKHPISDIYNLVPLKNAKKIMGYQPYETGGLQITLDHISDPEIVISIADKLHKALTPEPAIIQGAFQNGSYMTDGTAMAFDNDQKSINILSQQFDVVKGNPVKPGIQSKEIVINQAMAKELNVNVGDMVSFQYKTRFEDLSPLHVYKISAIIAAKSKTDKKIAFFDKSDLYEIYLMNLPEKYPDISISEKHDPIFQALAPSWRLLERTRNSEELQNKWTKLSSTKWTGKVLDVTSLQELFMAGLAFKLDAAMKVICRVDVIIIFFIILVGVVNTLRMTIRERTREIGTVRAIGMQKFQVISSFIMETAFLTFIGYASGIIIGIITINLLSMITFPPDSAISIILEEGHLHFLTTLQPILIDLGLIFLITVVTAYFPSRKAADLIVADALRHYE